MAMQINKSTRVRQDFTSAIGEAVFSASLNEGQFSMSLSGIAGPSVQITMPPEMIPSMIEFLTLVSQDINPA